MTGLEMDQNDPFAMALGLGATWKVVRSGFEEADEESKLFSTAFMSCNRLAEQWMKCAKNREGLVPM